MYEGRYIGPLPNLKGEEALLIPVGGGKVDAQFSNYKARRAGVDLSHGWHRFEESFFERIGDEQV